jgi:phosphoribosylamine--glycine ligase
MRILVVGSGGREHAICHAFSRSARVEKLFCAPGNAGIAQIAECVAIKAEDISDLAEFAIRERVDLTFVGGEGPLALGIVDEFESRGLRIVGASRDAARLESSKAFAKDFMSRHGIPTARYRTAGSPAEAIAILESGYFGDADAPVVVKADGLAAGKGVVVARDRAEAVAACGELAGLVGPDAAEKIVLEEFLDGREVSLLMFVDGQDFALMPPVRDHKRIGEGDTGPNTGGMGTITDAGLLTPEETQTVVTDIIEPTLRGCGAEGFPFRGILFLGLMMVGEAASPHVRDDEEQQLYVTAVPKVLEYNVRFGDPETQSIMVRLESDLVEICEAIVSRGEISFGATGSAAGEAGRSSSESGARTSKRLADLPIKWTSGNSACVVLAAEGYPQKPRAGDVIYGLDKAAAVENVTIFHAGTAKKDDGGSLDAETEKSQPSFITAGGRVLGITATGDTLPEALEAAYRAAEMVSWKGMQYRRDIGK